jgi:hypothetical protein
LHGPRLLAAAELAVAPGSTRGNYQPIVEEVRDLHLQTARAVLADDAQYAAVAAELRHECEQLHVFLEAAQVLGEMSTRSLDAVLGVGEKLACRLFVAVLRSHVRLHQPRGSHTGAGRSSPRVCAYLPTCICLSFSLYVCVCARARL